MIARIIAIFSISLILADVTESAPALAKAKQFLPGIPGYIPVYIRSGNTPLEDINPDLAKAFNYHAQKYGRLAFGRSIEEKSDKYQNKEGLAEENKLSDINTVSLGDDNNVNYSDESKESHYIQKIPQA
ncbi:hypothetical protein JTB14_004375 [Gonioctena quinquepunctata]|nr:hypothetical protein JTB14_004375 [Gonioctena quinquepunctata]